MNSDISDFIVFIYTHTDTNGLSRVYTDDRLNELVCNTLADAEAQAERFPSCTTVIYERLKNSNGATKHVTMGGGTFGNFGLYLLASVRYGKKVKSHHKFHPLAYAFAHQTGYVFGNTVPYSV